MIDLVQLLTQLAADRPIFHSEADFQHALAWRIHQRHPNAGVRLEYRPAHVATPMYVDIWIAFPDGAIAALEVKYKTRALAIDHAGESFQLRAHSAADQGRYDFLLDIARLEAVTAQMKTVQGAALILSNDSGYWSAPRATNTCDAAFRIHDGKALTGELAWGIKASPGTMRNRTTPIKLSASYTASWSSYS